MTAEHVVVIAEVGECWNGDFSSAERLIDVAASAGCDYVKFQTLDREGIAEDDPEREWFLKIALDEPQLQRLRRRAADAGIQFLATPEKAHNADILKAIGCDEIKIASSCLIDRELIERATLFSTVFLSTGLATLDEVDAAVAGLSRVANLFLLHCIAEYPTGPLLEERGLVALDDEEVHISMMRVLAERYPHARVGYSDHTSGLTAPLVAVAAGAKVIEKHITLDRRTPVQNFKNGGAYMGTDHVLSLEPDELKEMVRSIRKVERMLGNKVWERSAGEKKLRTFLRERFHQAS